MVSTDTRPNVSLIVTTSKPACEKRVAIVCRLFRTRIPPNIESSVADASSAKDLVPALSWQRWMSEGIVSLRIPVTTPTRYVSFQAALNLRLPGEETGDWHYCSSFFTYAEYPHTIRLAGPSGRADTTSSLGSRGVRDMAHILANEVIP